VVCVNCHWEKQGNIQQLYVGKLWCFRIKTVGNGKFSPSVVLSVKVWECRNKEGREFFVINWHSFLAGVWWQVLQTNCRLHKTQIRSKSFGNVLNLCNTGDRKCNSKLINWVYVFFFFQRNSQFLPITTDGDKAKQIPQKKEKCISRSLLPLSNISLLNICGSKYQSLSFVLCIYSQLSALQILQELCVCRKLYNYSVHRLDRHYNFASSVI